MRTIFLRTLVVGGLLWVVACADDSTLPTFPQFDHIPGRQDAFADLQAQIVALFPGNSGKGKGKGNGNGGGTQNAALKRLRNIDRQLLRNVDVAQRMAFELGEFAMRQLNAGKLQGGDPAGALDELLADLSFFVGGEGGFALEIVSPPPPGGQTTVVTDNGHASVIIEDDDLTETILVSIQQIVQESCDLETDLVQSDGCWRFNRFPAGDFANDVEITICVDVEDVPPSLLPFLRLHKGDPGQPIQPLVATAGDALICDGFDPIASLGSNSLVNFASAVSGGLRALLGPKPLFASVAFGGRLGGLAGSFSDFGGAVPFHESFESGIPGTWPSTGTVGTSGTTTNIAATDASLFATMLTPGVATTVFEGTGGSTLESSSFEALAGDVLSLDFNFLTTDGAGFTDFMFIQLIDATTSDAVATLANVNTTGPTSQAVPAVVGAEPVNDNGTLYGIN